MPRQFTGVRLARDLIDGVDYRESEAMLAYPTAWVRRPEFMVHHEWSPNGIAV